MGIAGAGFGASVGLEQVLERRLREAVRQQQERQAAEQMSLQRDQLAGMNTDREAMRENTRRTIDLNELKRRDDNNARGLDLMKSDKQALDTDAAVQKLPPHLKQIGDLFKIGAVGKLSPDDFESPDARATREAKTREQSVQDQIRVRNATREPKEPNRDPIADHEAKLKLDAKYKTAGGSGPSPYASERAARTVQSVDELLGKVSRWTTGAGSLLSNLPETDARNFLTELDTLKANIAFNELAQMREASKTGGALGAVSEREMQLLQSTLGGLDVGQSPENLKAQLKKVKDSVERWQKAAGSAPISNGETVNVPSGGSASRVDELLQKYGKPKP